MKKITILFFVGMIIIQPTLAQLEKGSVLLGASTNMGYNSYTFKTGPDATLFNISLKGGYFVANQFLMGLNISYFNNSQSSGSSSNTTTVSEIGVFARYYAGKFFMGVGLNNFSTSSSSSGLGFNYSGNSSGTTIPLEMGFAVFATPNFAIEPSLRYVTANGDGSITFGGLSTGAKSSLGLNIGFTLYVGRKE